MPARSFKVTISLRKTNILAQGAESSPVITIDNTELEVVDTFTYLGSTMSSSTLLNAEISFRIAKAAAVMAKLNKQVWGNDLLSESTKMCVYQACVLLTLLYGSKSWVHDLCQTRAVTQRIPPPLPSAKIGGKILRDFYVYIKEHSNQNSCKGGPSTI